MTSKTAARVAALGLLTVAAVVAFMFRDRLDFARLDAVVASAGVLGPAAYMATYALATVLFVPGAIFGIAGGALFGPVWGTVWNLAGATAGAALSFLAARHFAADWVERKTGGLTKRLIAGVEAEGWRFVAVARLVPFVPFNLLNYALGLTRISFGQYVLASLICMAPGAAAYTWLGFAGKATLAGEASAIRYSLLAVGLLTIMAFAPRFLRRLRSGRPAWIEADELKAMLDADAPPLVVDVRGRGEFDGELGHLVPALNLPIDELAARLPELQHARQRRVVLVCHTDKRSAKAAEVLRDAGFVDVVVLRGGIARWRAAGHPVTRAGAQSRKET